LGFVGRRVRGFANPESRIPIPTRALAFLTVALLSVHIDARPPDVVRSVGAVPAHIAGRFRDPSGFQQAASGQYFVFDRRAHVVFGLDSDRASAWEIVHIGGEEGRIIDPTAFAVEPNGTLSSPTRRTTASASRSSHRPDFASADS
jgi:hypothetical protein